MVNYYTKYLKYKNKYLQLKNQFGGDRREDLKEKLISARKHQPWIKLGSKYATPSNTSKIFYYNMDHEEVQVSNITTEYKNDSIPVFEEIINSDRWKDLIQKMNNVRYNYNNWVQLGSKFGTPSNTSLIFYYGMDYKEVQVSNVTTEYKDDSIPVFEEIVKSARWKDLIQQMKDKGKYEKWVELGSKYGIPSDTSYFYYDMDDKEISVSQITNVYKDDRIPVFKRVTSTRRSTLPEMTMIEDNPFSALEGRSLP